ncbi:wax ester/triacylglycerol synthase family O-acyltransferase [Luteimonas sp. RD2P54]|uniref:diacylglycerol O-acyltransferase n=1 Tax=Luteimonas endophytica TaxID=3042023 RepID=A0ABT6J976_9GAMM|nr:wax ester/triacylglycerol synthase family O-acyltransferase [Luteimonas endophytica]MDH5823160.1 wax ester/triacylglycerol synthase family O-acyltransferase [Luteimonas endophytica]
MATENTRRRPRREPMSRVDTAWLRMEKPSNPMMITGVLMLAEPLALDALRRLLADRFLAYARFRQRPVDTATGCCWQDDPGFELDRHVQRARLPGRGDKRALERFASKLASTRLEPGRPLWQFHLVERYGGGSALVARIHHCYADGMALVQVLLSLTDTVRDPAAGQDLARAWLRQDGAGVARRVGAVQRYRRLGGKALGKGIQMYRDPGLAAVLAREGGDIARELLAALSLPDDPPSLLRGRLGTSKRVAWAEPLDLDEVKAVGRACGCTVNDVLMAAAAGALRGYMQARGDSPDGLTLRATVPVNLRPLEHARRLGNHFGLVFLELPVGEPNPVRRLARVSECMSNVKNSKQAVVAYGLLAALGMMPQPLQESALALLSRKATAVATNVPGPQQPLYLGGSALREMMFWVPQTGSIGIGVSILSYNGRVHFGLIADARLVPDPDAVIGRFGPEFEKLLYLALMSDWEAALLPEAAEALLDRR